MTATARTGVGPGGTRAVATTALLWAALLATMIVTYSRLDPVRLYHVTRRGLGGGLSRALVEIDYPVALVAIAVALLLVPALGHTARRAAAVAIVLCATTVVPGVVDELDLDARWVNVVPAVGVAMVLALAVGALRGRTGRAPRRAFDGVRLATAIVLAVVSLPWMAAEAGVFLPDGMFQMRHPIIGETGVVEAVVHLGHHHGLDGLLLAVTSMLLTRVPLPSGRLTAAIRAYLALLFVYGVVNLAEDSWNEQVVTSGWSTWTFPSATSPSLSVVWLVIVVATVAVSAALRWEAGSLRAAGAPVV